MKEQVFYFEDELNDEFSKAKITPRNIDETYIYEHKNPLWNFASFILQNIISMPIKILYGKIKLRLKYIGKEKLKEYKKDGYFVYVNHTQELADVFIPSLPIYPKRNFFIVNPDNMYKLCHQDILQRGIFHHSDTHNYFFLFHHYTYMIGSEVHVLQGQIHKM